MKTPEYFASTTNSAQGVLPAIVQHGYCSGCGACAGLLGAEKVQMRLSTTGYLRPVVLRALTHGEDHLVKTVCPGITLKHDRQTTPVHAIWGPIHTVRTGHAADPVVRRAGSSGGVISALALYLIESGKVDFVAQIAVDADKPLVNLVQKSKTREDVLRAAGSRYAPAAPLSCLEEYLATGQRFAFIGKPCDVAALRNLARVDDRVAKQIPFMLSFMCAGVPSIHGTHELVGKMGLDSSKLKSLKYRGDGWPGMARAEGVNGQVAEMDYAKSWGTILNRHLQFRCKICPDGTGEFADIVCADAWYGKDGYPDFEERDGRSLVLTRTAVGDALLREAVDARVINVFELPADDIAAMQPYQVNRKQVVLGRLLGTRLRHGWVPGFSNMGLLRATLSSKPLDWVRSAIGTYRRAEGERP